MHESIGFSVISSPVISLISLSLTRRDTASYPVRYVGVSCWSLPAHSFLLWLSLHNPSRGADLMVGSWWKFPFLCLLPHSLPTFTTDWLFSLWNPAESGSFNSTQAFISWENRINIMGTPLLKLRSLFSFLRGQVAIFFFLNVSCLLQAPIHKILCEAPLLYKNECFFS